MSTVDRQHSTLLRQRRNRIVSGFYRSNPSIRIPDGSADIRLQISLGSQTIRRQNAGSGVAVISPCGCSTPAPGEFLRSKNNITDGGFPIGDEPEKDMANAPYTDEFDPMDYYPSFFPGMAEFTDANIVAGDKSEEDRLQASYWDDLGDDVFDNWGYFYLYDVASGKYYFPLITPQNQDDGIFTTQTFNVFGRTFTITHGWAVQGIFKFDISVADALPFRFGAYGEMGSDGDEFTEDLTHPYTIGGAALTLYYHHHEEDGDTYEKLYSYFVPKVVSENMTQTYNAYYDSDDMSMISKEVTSGLIVYFSKTNDVKEWVANDLEFGSP
jgi:hypothetical protein